MLKSLFRLLALHSLREHHIWMTGTRQTEKPAHIYRSSAVKVLYIISLMTASFLLLVNVESLPRAAGALDCGGIAAAAIPAYAQTHGGVDGRRLPPCLLPAGSQPQKATMLTRAEPSRHSDLATRLKSLAKTWFSLRDRQKAVLCEALSNPLRGAEAATGHSAANGALHGQLNPGYDAAAATVDDLDAEDVYRDFWKVLVIDQTAREVLAPVLKVPTLRTCGVTLHLNLESSRQVIPEVPAVYLIQPNHENIQTIVRDCAADRYAHCSIYFLSAISRDELERLAEALARARRIESVTRVVDLYCGFVCLKRNLFSMPPSIARRSFRRLFSAQADEQAIQETIATIVDSLFAVCVTLRCVPYIRCLRRGASERVALQLCAKIWEYMHTPGGAALFREHSEAGLPPLRRPLLALLDRDVDLAIMLHHGWTYEALIHELLPFELSRVSMPATKPGTERTQYDLDDEADPFWAENASLPFPQVAEHIETALTAYRAQVQEINARTGGGSNVQKLLAETADETQLEAYMQATGTSTREIADAVAELPRLTRWKRQLDMHTNIASALLEQIKARKLDLLFQLEDSLLERPSSVQSNSLDRFIGEADLLAKPHSSTASADASSLSQRARDCLRLLLMYQILSPSGIPQTKLAEYCHVLDICGCQTSALSYVMRQRAATPRQLDPAATHRDGNSPSPARKSSSRMIDRLTTATGGGREIFESLVTRIYEHGHKGLTQLASTVKGLIPTTRSGIVASIVDSWMRNASPDDDLDSASRGAEHEHPGAAAERAASLLLDPLAARDGHCTNKASSLPRGSFTEAIVFMVGGGNFIEWENLTTRIHDDRQIIYGTTEMLSPEAFLDDLTAAAAAATNASEDPKPPQPSNGL